MDLTHILEEVESKFNVFIYQDTNYSDQSDKFYRFNICKNKNSPVIGKVIYMNGIFKGGLVLGYDGSYSKNDLLNSITDFLNQN